MSLVELVLSTLVDTAPPLVYFRVPGEPVPKQSFRWAARGWHGYRSSRVSQWQENVSGAAREAFAPRPPLTGPLALSLDFSCRRRRGDLDNLSKAVLDGLEGILFQDDSQVVALFLRKRAARSAPGVDVRLWELASWE